MSRGKASGSTVHQGQGACSSPDQNSRNRGRLVMGWAGAAIFLWTAGCRSVPIGEQGRLSKPNMIFADTAVFGYDSALVTQVEPGAASNGGAKAAGCNSCKKREPKEPSDR